MLKPRIFVAMHYMEIGGAEASLIGLLEALDPAKVDVDLFVYSHQGVFMKAIPDYVNLLPENKAYAMFEKPMVEVLKRGHFRIVMARLLAKYKCWRYYRTHTGDGDRSAIQGYLGAEVSKVVPHLYEYGTYDLAISYLTPHHFVLDHVLAKHKLAWIHTDYSKVSVDTRLELPVWGAYDGIVSISADVTKGFLHAFPTLRNKVLELQNILSERYILSRADQPVAHEGYRQKGMLTLCSVGRISHAKNYDNIPYMAQSLKRLMQSGGSMYGDFRWYIVGPGDHSAIDALSEALGVRENVVFLGASDNPYPYIKHCDIYVHPSRYEGKSIVVREAQVLCKPVVITDYPTAHSQLTDGVDGVICPLDNMKIAEAIYSLAHDEERRTKIVNHLLTHDYTGVEEVEKLYDLCIG